MTVGGVLSGMLDVLLSTISQQPKLAYVSQYLYISQYLGLDLNVIAERVNYRWFRQYYMSIVDKQTTEAL